MWLLLRDLDAGRFSLIQFYVRRTKRLLPALIVIILAVLFYPCGEVAGLRRCRDTPVWGVMTR